MVDQRVRRDSASQRGVSASYNRLSSHGIRLRPISDLRTPPHRHQNRVLILPTADAYRGLFTFGVFNAIQSTCFDDVSFLFCLLFSVF